jgi:hypothetical protein
MKDQGTLLQQLLDVASIKRLQSKPYNLLKRSGPVENSWWAWESHSSSNHVLATMSFIGEESLVRLYIADRELDLRSNYVFRCPIQCALLQGHMHNVKMLVDTYGGIETLPLE